MWSQQAVLSEPDSNKNFGLVSVQGKLPQAGQRHNDKSHTNQNLL